MFFSSLLPKASVHTPLSKNPVHHQSLWGIAWMCFFWSTSSLLIFSYLPIFLTEELGASRKTLGAIEGVCYGIAFLFKIFSGVLSDYIKSRRGLILAGCLGNVLIKPIFALATSVWWVFIARFLDRVAKGVRASPTDALIGDLSDPDTKGRSYGVRQTLYPLGAAFGCILATFLGHIFDHQYRLIFAFATIPSVIALLVFIFVIKTPQLTKEQETKKRLTLKLADIKLLPSTFWKILSIVFLLMFARFSESFVLLRAKEIGWTLTYLPLIIVLVDIIHAIVAYITGFAIEKKSPIKILLIGISFLGITDLIFIHSVDLTHIMIACVLLGIHMGMTQGTFASLIAKNTPAHLKGTAFSLFYLTEGFSVLLGNCLAGYLGDTFGMVGTFYGGFVFTLMASLLLLKYLKTNLNEWNLTLNQ